MIVGLIANSISIILDAVNNLSDALSSIITIIGTKLSEKRPNKKHPFGYGRIEYFSSIIIAVIVLLAGLTAFKESFDKIINPNKADYSVISLIIIIVAIFVKLFFGKYVKKSRRNDAISDSVLSFLILVVTIISLIWNITLG